MIHLQFTSINYLLAKSLSGQYQITFIIVITLTLYFYNFHKADKLTNL
jgi:hypothetical protein